MWPGFNLRSRRHIWVEFVVGSRPCSEEFSSGTPVFLPPQKPTLSVQLRTHGHLILKRIPRELLGAHAPWVNRLVFLLERL